MPRFITISRRYLGIFVIPCIVVAVISCYTAWSNPGANSFAQQPASPVDVTGSATFTQLPDGFQVTFNEPVSLSSISYNGPYQGHYQVLEAPKGNTNEPISLIDKALEVKPDEPTLLDTKGLIFLKEGRPQDAIPLMERAVEITCEGPLYVLHLAYAQMKAGDSNKAVNTFDKVRSNLTPKIDQLSPDNKDMLNELEMKLGGPEM